MGLETGVGRTSIRSLAPEEFKTSDGKVKPQAARFRIFEYEKGK